MPILYKCVSDCIYPPTIKWYHNFTMNILSSFLVAAGLSMDNMAATVSAGCARGSCPQRMLWQISALFAAAHFIMFSVGFEGGVLLHAGRKAGAWAACIILVIIGVRMIKSGFHPADEACTLFASLRTQLALAVATSLDALFVGAGMAFSSIPFWQTVLWITGCVFVTSFGGFYAGHYLGKKFGPRMEIAGGCVLVLLGIKVLLDGIGIL